jgi:hypothetical protein
MSTTITLPDDVVRKLEARASVRKMSLDDLIAKLLNDMLERDDASPALGQVIAEIKMARPNPAVFHPATQSLADKLANSPADPTFDAQGWNREWAQVEAEMKAITRANNVAEGRA